MHSLQIYDPRERALVGLADRLLTIGATAARPFRRRTRPDPPRRILLLRLERIGDLLMALPAVRDVRTLAPAAEIDLAVGSWNAALAAAAPYVNRVEQVDAPWLARGDARRGSSLVSAARRWRQRGYDLAINFEPDVRTNLLLAASGARWTSGWVSGGGGALLDLGLEFDPKSHTSDNARRLIAATFERSAALSTDPLLVIPEPARRAARDRLSAPGGGPLVGIHVSGGRLVKQWDPERVAEVARRLAVERGATIVLTGAPADRPMVDVVKAGVPAGQAIDVAGDIDLPELAAVLEQLDLLLTGDTGPMHLASAVGTPIVAVFGPSDPVRYAPSGAADRIIRVDLPCSPCNRIRLPPERCVGHIPECLTSIPAARVFDAVLASLDQISADSGSSASRRQPSEARPANHATA
jgi:ADP-heptose:LPS heptosyltransferase